MDTIYFMSKYIGTGMCVFGDQRLFLWFMVCVWRAENLIIVYVSENTRPFW